MPSMSLPNSSISHFRRKEGIQMEMSCPQTTQSSGAQWSLYTKEDPAENTVDLILRMRSTIEASLMSSAFITEKHDHEIIKARFNEAVEVINKLMSKFSSTHSCFLCTQSNQKTGAAEVLFRVTNDIDLLIISCHDLNDSTAITLKNVDAIIQLLSTALDVVENGTQIRTIPESSCLLEAKNGYAPRSISPSYAWAKILQHIEYELGEVSVSALFDEAEVKELTERRLTISTSSSFRKELIEQRCRDSFKSASEEVLGYSVELEVLRSDNTCQEEPFCYSYSYMWAKVLSYLEDRISAVTISYWLDDVDVLKISNDQIILYSPSEFRREIIKRRLVELIQDAMFEIFNRRIDVILTGDRTSQG